MNMSGIPIKAYRIVMAFPSGVFGARFPYPIMDIKYGLLRQIVTNGCENGQREHKRAAESPNPDTRIIAYVASMNIPDNLFLKPV